jgi:Flp pilus assembly protein TadG
VAPVFFLLVFVLIEAGRMMMIRQSLTNAAREGCRAAALATTSSSSKVEAAVRDYLRSLMSVADNATKLRVTTPAGLASCNSGTNLTVTVEVDYRDVSWLPLHFFDMNPTIGSQQTGQRE